MVKKKTKKTAKKRKVSKPKLDIKPVKNLSSQTDVINHLAEVTETTPKEAKLHYNALKDTILGCLHPKGQHEFMMAGIVKLMAKRVPAKPKRPGRNPATGETIMLPAKAATTKAKARMLSKAKQAVVAG